MKRAALWLLMMLGAGLLAALIWHDLKGNESPSSRTTASPEVIRGNYGKYLYAITKLDHQDKKLVQFDPSLAADDTVVLPVLKAVARAGYGVSISEDAQPTVETVKEVNVIVFSAEHSKIYYELFRNSHGEVGSAWFWQQ